MGRSPCCDKLGLKKGPWSPEEDQKLLAYIEENGHVSWRALPAKAGLQRCGKSCRLRWTNYLRPDIKRGKFTLQEEQTIIQLHALLGNRWSAIACHLPKRTDNEIKNYWNTHLRKRLDKMGIDPATHRPKSAALGPAHGHQTKGSANLSHMAQWESARLEAEARLLRESKLRSAAIQSQLSPAATSAGEWKPAAPPLCLNVLKAWQGAWSGNSSPAGCATSGIDLESPTSTLNFSEDAARPPAQTNSSSIMVSFTDKCNKEEEDQLDWKVSCQEVDGEWSDQGYSSKIESQRGSMFMEGFSDLLLENSYYQTSSNSKGEAANVAGHGEEDGKDYWKNILNLVNSSPSDSPLF